MEETLKQAMTQVPSLVVLVIVVWAFLRHIESQRVAGASERGELVKSIQTGTAEHIQARTEMAVVIKENSASNTAVARAVEQMAQSVKSCPLKERREHD